MIFRVGNFYNDVISFVFYMIKHNLNKFRSTTYSSELALKNTLKTLLSWGLSHHYVGKIVKNYSIISGIFMSC